MQFTSKSYDIGYLCFFLNSSSVCKTSRLLHGVACFHVMFDWFHFTFHPLSVPIVENILIAEQIQIVQRVCESCKLQANSKHHKFILYRICFRSDFFLVSPLCRSYITYDCHCCCLCPIYSFPNFSSVWLWPIFDIAMPLLCSSSIVIAYNFFYLYKENCLLTNTRTHTWSHIEYATIFSNPGWIWY